MVKVLVVEDEASIREMIALNLRLAGGGGGGAARAGAAEPKPPCLCWSRSPAVMLPFWM